MIYRSLDRQIFSDVMIPQFRPPVPSPPPQFALTGNSQTRGSSSKAVMGLGTATIGIVYVFNVDLRVDMQTMNDMITKCCNIAAPAEDPVGGTSFKTRHQTQPFIQFRRVPNETFGIALFRAAAPAARTAMALTGINLFGKQLFCQMDRRTQQLLEQWKFLRGKEMSSKISSQGYDVPQNIIELVNSELSEQVNRAKGLAVEQASLNELRITRFQGLAEADVLAKLEDDRIQQVLVRRAEESVQIDKTSAELRVLSSQLKEHQSRLSQVKQDVAVKSESLTHKRKLELKSRSSPSIFELRQLIPGDRETLFRFPIDWDGIFTTRGHSIMKTFSPWVVRKVKDFLGSYDRELAEYILRKVKLRVDPLDFITDMRQYIDDDAEGFVKEIWSVLVFETLRRKHM
jgi:hypothetical protein